MSDSALFEYEYGSSPDTLPDDSASSSYEPSGGGGSTSWPTINLQTKTVSKGEAQSFQQQQQQSGGGSGGLWGAIGTAIQGIAVGTGMAAQGYFASEAVKQQYQGELKLLREFKRQRKWLASKASSDFTKQLSSLQVMRAASAEGQVAAAGEATRRTTTYVFIGLGAIVLTGIAAAVWLGRSR